MSEGVATSSQGESQSSVIKPFMNELKPNCYLCKFRGELAGDAHSECTHPSINPSDRILTGFALMAGQRAPAMKRLNISGNAHGIRKGWFFWPINFDPVWLESCDGFKAKEAYENKPQESDCKPTSEVR